MEKSSFLRRLSLAVLFFNAWQVYGQGSSDLKPAVITDHKAPRLSEKLKILSGKVSEIRGMFDSLKFSPICDDESIVINGRTISKDNNNYEPSVVYLLFTKQWSAGIHGEAGAANSSFSVSTRKLTVSLEATTGDIKIYKYPNNLVACNEQNLVASIDSNANIKGKRRIISRALCIADRKLECIEQILKGAE